MEGGKDNRSKEKRRNMKQHQHAGRKPQQRVVCGVVGGNTSSSSVQAAAVHSIVDVADSSDEPRFAQRRGWGQQKPLPQRNLERLNMDPLENGYCNNDIDMNYVNEKGKAQLQAGDFKQMAQLSSGGDHFAFNDEKQWIDAHQGDLPMNVLKAAEKYFVLNLKLLNTGLQTIPFYKRMDYASSMFTAEQLSKMNEEAEKAEKQYQKILRPLNDANPRINVNSASNRSGSAKSGAKDELDELLNITTQELAKGDLLADSIITTTPKSNPIAPNTTSAAADNKDDIQNWLDNVLEE